MASQTKNQNRFFIVSILGIAALTRFWKLAELFHWTLDEEFWSYVPHNLAIFENFPLIGGHIGGTGVYSGPVFVWLMGIVFFIVQSNPLGVALFVSALGVVTTYFVYKLSQNFSNRTTALIASNFYASSTLATLYDRKYWNASLSSILGLATIFLVQKFKKNPSIKIAIGLIAVLSLGIQAHMTGLVMIVFCFVALFFSTLEKKWLVAIFLGLVLTHAPLVVFDLRHDFFNTKALISFVTSPKTSETKVSIYEVADLTINTFGRVLYLPGVDISQELTLCKEYSHSRSRAPSIYLVLVVVILGYSLYLLTKKDLLALFLWTNILLVAIYQLLSPSTFYPGLLSEYFYLPSFGVFIIVLARFLNLFRNRLPELVFGVVAMVMIINLQTTLNLKHSYGYASKLEQVESAIKGLDTSSFSLDVVGQSCQVYGYRYLFDWLGYPPSQSYVDSVLGWLYQSQLENSPETTVVLNNETQSISVAKRNKSY